MLRFDRITGAFIDAFVPPLSGGLAGPRGMVFGPDGNLYVCSFTSDRVLRFNGTTGAFLDVFAAGGGLDGPIDLRFGPDGNLYVSSFNSSAVLRFNGTTGAFTDAFVPTGLGGLFGPAGIEFGPDGNLYVCSFNTNAVLRFNGTTGAFIDAFVPTNSGGLRGPIGMVFGPDGNLYVCSFATDAVLRFDGTTGAFLKVFASGGGLNGPDSLLFTSAATLSVFPTTGTVVSTGGFDLTLIVETFAAGLSIVGGKVTLDDTDVTTALAGCVRPGTLAVGGLTLRCPGLSGGIFTPGRHVLSVELNLNDGSQIRDTVIWRVLGNTEP